MSAQPAQGEFGHYNKYELIPLPRDFAYINLVAMTEDCVYEFLRWGPAQQAI